MWLPDLDGFFAVVSRLLRTGSWVFVIDQHPLLDMFGMEPTKERTRIEESYFRLDPFMVMQGLDYYRNKPLSGSKPCYRFHYKLSDIINACINNGFRLETIEELPTAEGGGYFKRFEMLKYRFPLSFTMTAIRT